MIELAFDRQPVRGFEDLIDVFREGEFDSPYRSTVPLLAHWRDPQDRLDELVEVVGGPITGPVQLAFEYTVFPARGRGRPSCTDLMIQGSDVGIAVEAKYKEPPYETVEEWLGSDPTRNRQEVLGGWLDLIQVGVGPELGLDSVLDLPYQLIHRTASVFSLPQERRGVVYLVFGDLGEHYVDKIQRWSELLGGDSVLRIRLVECPVRPLPDHLQLEARWDSGERALAGPVKAVLKSGVLYQFGSLRVLSPAHARE